MSTVLIFLVLLLLVQTARRPLSINRPSSYSLINDFNLWALYWRLLSIRELPVMLIDYLLNRPQSMTSHALFFRTFFGLLGKFAKADGLVEKDELDTVNKFIQKKLSLNPQQVIRAQQAFREGRDSEIAFEHYLIVFYNHFKRRPEILRILLDLLEEIAASDKKLSRIENELIAVAKQLFGFTRDEFEKARFSSKFKFENESNNQNKRGESWYDRGPYAVLGLQPGATHDEIKKAYRKLVKEYHPDRLIARGLSPELRNAAIERFRGIQTAYEALMKVN